MPSWQDLCPSVKMGSMYMPGSYTLMLKPEKSVQGSVDTSKVFAGPAGLGRQAGGLAVLGQVRLIGLEKGGIAGLPGGPDAGEGFRSLVEDRIGRVHVVVDPQAGFRGIGGAKGLQAVDRFRQQPKQGGIEPAPLEGGNIQPGGEGIGTAHVVCKMQIVFPAGPGFQIDGMKSHKKRLPKKRWGEGVTMPGKPGPAVHIGKGAKGNALAPVFRREREGAVIG